MTTYSVDANDPVLKALPIALWEGNGFFLTMESLGIILLLAFAALLTTVGAAGAAIFCVILAALILALCIMVYRRGRYPIVTLMADRLRAEKTGAELPWTAVTEVRGTKLGVGSISLLHSLELDLKPDTAPLNLKGDRRVFFRKAYAMRKHPVLRINVSSFKGLSNSQLLEMLNTILNADEVAQNEKTRQRPEPPVV